MNRDELNREIALADLLDALAAAKKSKNRDQLHNAKIALYAHRVKDRDAASPGRAGEAKPETVKVKVKGT